MPLIPVETGGLEVDAVKLARDPTPVAVPVTAVAGVVVVPAVLEEPAEGLDPGVAEVEPAKLPRAGTGGLALVLDRREVVVAEARVEVVGAVEDDGVDLEGTKVRLVVVPVGFAEEEEEEGVGLVDGVGLGEPTRVSNHPYPTRLFFQPLNPLLRPSPYSLVYASHCQSLLCRWSNASLVLRKSKCS